jgi:hypothetical protein
MWLEQGLVGQSACGTSGSGESVHKSRPAKSAPADQVKVFRKAARELGGDESDSRFKDTLRKIARHKPEQRNPSNGRDEK